MPYPLKTQDTCTTRCGDLQSSLSISYTFLVSSAFRSYRYLLVSGQSIYIRSFILYHRFFTASAVWWLLGLFPLAILLSQRSTQIRWADSVISIRNSRFLVPSCRLKLARPPPSCAFRGGEVGVIPSFP